ncbi:hypothetical protein [Piscinibacter terrae]|uniref:hypothetical protein n=1 Tax=Piscinibacter terrae TaxID=2496871 RepID=UPI000F58FC1F|nr:hypothetical protein [Albitalea terrae]
MVIALRCGFNFLTEVASDKKAMLLARDHRAVLPDKRIAKAAPVKVQAAGGVNALGALLLEGCTAFITNVREETHVLG